MTRFDDAFGQAFTLLEALSAEALVSRYRLSYSALSSSEFGPRASEQVERALRELLDEPCLGLVRPFLTGAPCISIRWPQVGVRQLIKDLASRATFCDGMVVSSGERRSMAPATVALTLAPNGEHSEASHLTDKDIRCLTMIADGHDYRRIVDEIEDYSYRDIFDAARRAAHALKASNDRGHQNNSAMTKALAIGNHRRTETFGERMDRVRQQHWRAWDPWSVEDDSALLTLWQTEKSIPRLSARLGRTRNAITSRLKRHDLIQS